MKVNNSQFQHRKEKLPERGKIDAQRETICFKCQKPGHISKYCRSRTNTSRNYTNAKGMDVVLSNAITDKDAWVIDSGAMHHMTPNEKYFAMLKTDTEVNNKLNFLKSWFSKTLNKKNPIVTDISAVCRNILRQKSAERFVKGCFQVRETFGTIKGSLDSLRGGTQKTKSEAVALARALRGKFRIVILGGLEKQPVPVFFCKAWAFVE